MGTSGDFSRLPLLHSSFGARLISSFFSFFKIERINMRERQVERRREGAERDENESK